MASFSVVTNVAANNAQANLYATNIGLRTALTRVSSGFRINNSGDDAAGLAVANGYRSTVAVLNQGVRNANDGLSDLQIKDGALDNVSKLLDRLSTLATQAASGQTTSTSRFVSNNSTDGKVGGSIGAVTTTALGINASVLTSQAGAESAVAAVANAVTSLGTVQGQVGQLQNRLSYAISLAQSQIVNNKAAESRIRDANVAEESANLTRFSILNQSGIAALAQANGQTGAVLSLLRG